MYKINPPKIHLSTVLGYDVEGKRYIVKDEKIFDTERELVCFLARYNRPVCNFEGEPIAGRYNNKYMDNQALNGLMRKDLYDSTYDEIMYTMYHYPISRLHYKSINGEREVPGQQKVVRGSNIPVLTSHVGQNPRSKSGYEPERRVINGEREIPSRQKIVRGSNVSVLISHVGLSPRSCTTLSLVASFAALRAGYEHEARVIKSEEWEFLLLAHHRWTGETRPCLSSGEACYKQSGPEQSELFVGNDSDEHVQREQTHRPRQAHTRA